MMLAALLVLPLALMPQTKPAPAQSQQRAASATSSIGAVDGALVLIETEEGAGSGFQFVNQGYVITNRHVLDEVPTGGSVTLRPVKEGQNGAVGLGDPFRGTVRYKHPHLDVAVIEVPKAKIAKALKPIVTPGNKHVPRGTTLIAHGFPGIGRNATPTVSQGLLSAHYTDPRSGQVLYLSDVALSPGSSGGPVTDASGAVIGVATAVSIVTDGAGNSWGYVLPIRVIEEAISCTKGIAALPKPFNPSKHMKAIAAAKSADDVMAAYESAVGEVVKQTGSAIELDECMNQLLKAVAATKVALPRDRFKAFNDSANRAAVVLNTRLLELRILGEDNTAESIMARLYQDRSMDKWIEEVFERSFASLPEADRAIAYGELMSTHASGVVKLIAAAKSSCDSAREAAAALDRQDASRSKVQSLSNALSTLLVCYANILVVDPESIDANNTGFPLKVRQRLRESTTSLQNAIDEWAQLPEDCRQPIEEMGNSLMGLETESPNDDGETPRTKLEASLAWWKAKGFTVWVEVQTNTTEGNGHGYKIKFDEAPAIAWFGVRSDRAKRFEFSVTDPEGDKVEQTGGITHSDITWHGVELTKDGEYSITFTTDDAVDYPFEFVGVLRGSPFVTRRKWVRETNELKMFKEIETWSIYVDAGGRQKVTIDGTGYRSLLVACDDVDRNDIDIEVVDPDGDVVSKDVEDNPWPSAIIESPMQGEYTVRVLNTSRKDVIVDLIFFAVKMGH